MHIIFAHDIHQPFVFVDLGLATSFLELTALIGLTCLLVETKWVADQVIVRIRTVAVSVRADHFRIVFSIWKGRWKIEIFILEEGCEGAIEGVHRLSSAELPLICDVLASVFVRAKC